MEIYFVLFCLTLGSLEVDTEYKIQGKQIFEECSSEKISKLG